jgi:ankyrin repeat protein
MIMGYETATPATPPFLTRQLQVGETPLHHAAEHGRSEIVSKLICSKANLKAISMRVRFLLQCKNSR